MNQKIIERFLLQKSEWILKKMNHREGHPPIANDTKRSKAHFLKHKQTALELAQKKVVSFNQFYQFTFKKITIKNQKTRWGSCSRKGNLNFNYKIFFLPLPLAEYIITHELCHLKEMNHSGRFWRLVGQTVPDYANLRKKLRKLAVI